ncbi:MAG TPA: hypothetical protein VNW25_04510 [Candidatus Sulfotelmatobacter sp.]|jgi:hypothetical protein|nr:hypothetical protein [Candidatus Sulfotelmatobacter sp.]
MAGLYYFILYGFLLLFSSTAFLFTIGIVIIVTGFVLLLFFIIGAGPTTRRYRGPWFATPQTYPTPVNGYQKTSNAWVSFGLERFPNGAMLNANEVG